MINLIKLYAFFIFLTPFSTLSQITCEASFGGNTTTAKTIAGGNRTWGYRVTHILPNTWSNHFAIGYSVNKNKYLLAFDSGDLAVNYMLNVNPNKYPKYEFSGNSLEGDLSDATSIVFKSKRGVNLAKISFLYENNWNKKNKISHSSILGFGFLKTRVNSALGNVGSFYYIDSIGYFYHNFNIDQYGFINKVNFYLIAGYKFAYKINDRFDLNFSIIYNQGIFKMVKWHAYRTYSESFSEYTEFDEQWSFTRLSYFAFLGGISYTLKK